MKRQDFEKAAMVAKEIENLEKWIAKLKDESIEIVAIGTQKIIHIGDGEKMCGELLAHTREVLLNKYTAVLAVLEAKFKEI